MLLPPSFSPPTPSLARYQEGGRDVFIYHWQKTAQPFVLVCWGFQVCNNWVLNLRGQTPLTQWTDLEVELWSLRIYLLSVNAELLFYLPQFLLTPFRCIQQTNNEKYHAIFFVFFFFDTRSWNFRTSKSTNARLYAKRLSINNARDNPICGCHPGASMTWYVSNLFLSRPSMREQWHRGGGAAQAGFAQHFAGNAIGYQCQQRW